MKTPSIYNEKEHQDTHTKQWNDEIQKQDTNHKKTKRKEKFIN